MKLQNRTRWVAEPLQGYFFAVLMFLLAWGIRAELHSVFQDKFPAFLFFLASVITAYRYGFGPAMLCIGLAVPVTLYFFIPPFGEWGPIEPSDIYTLIFYLVGGVVCSGFLELLNRERYNSELLARVADSRFRMLVHMDEDRRYHESESMRMSGVFYAHQLKPKPANKE